MEKYKIILFLPLLFLMSSMKSNVNAQNISFLTDYLNNVSVFDNGNLKQVEHLPIKSYIVGNNMFAYEDNAGNFKIYHNHFLHKLSSFASSYMVSDNLAAWKMNTQLKVFDKGSSLTLSTMAQEYFLSDDIVVWFDDYEKKLKAYYNKEIYELDDALATGSSNEVFISENIVAFVASQGYLGVFYEGEIEDLGYYDRIKSLEIGRDIIAFVEEPLNNFQVYYFGDISDIESFEPNSYKTGDSFVAYVDANKYLKVFYNYKVETISFDEPNFYEVADELMVFGVQNYFKVWYKGQVFTLDSHIPQNYKINNNVAAWIDQLGYLKFFDGQKVETISYEKIENFEIHGSCVKYSFGVHSENIYFQAKTYKND
ncbi:MAG: hypothetical protein GX793_08340 [Bacteroidales bacterium]|jgi:hypothetical protein|nr:hypothetical protein [Bacteroidales bacterium]MCK9498985.1 hypothetical protein [Bacteroidales bacterium]MDY0314612.1 hypothetical protein [Bacteroidales bacterium]NLB86934.1 hypothetical protein [Bacteroidales bacterium]NLB87053.1 hypothetical protein [Bacteroidales bacterium]